MTFNGILMSPKKKQLYSYLIESQLNGPKERLEFKNR